MSLEHHDKIEWVSVDKLKPNPKNRNKHPEDQIRRLAELIKYQGWRSPIVVSNRSGLIVAGHGRLEAAILNGVSIVPVSYQDFVNEEQEIAYGVSDNAIASWASLDFAGINMDVGQLGPDFNIDHLGIKDFELEPADKYEDEDLDSVPGNVEPKAKLGQIYRLGQHRLMCGDSKDTETINRLLNGQSDYLLLTDPPYGMSAVKVNGQIGGDRVGKVSYGDNAHKYGAKAKTGTYRPIIGDDEFFDPTYLTLLGKDQIIFGANHFSTHLPLSPHWIVWYKDMPDNDFSGAELAWTSIKKKTVKTYKHTWAGMVRQGDRKDELTKRVHPTQKPVGLFEAILLDYKYDNILDLFGGSGSALIACEKTNRKCFMMELDPHYVDVIIARWEQFTGQKAELVETCQ